MKHSVLLDTSFFVRLLNDEDPLHLNARNYFKYFLEQEILLKISTVTIAEYCVIGEIGDLPLKKLHIIPFNIDHAKRAAEFAKCIFEEKKISKEQLMPRAIIPNDAKLFAQTDLDKTCSHFVTSDKRSGQVINLLRGKVSARFSFLDISTPYNQAFGILDL